MATVIGNNIGVSNSYQNSTGKAGSYKNVREYSNYLMGKFYNESYNRIRYESIKK